MLVALGVIFIPMILNRDDSGPGIADSNLPDIPSELARLSTQDIPPAPTPPAPPDDTTRLVDEATPPPAPSERTTPVLKTDKPVHQPAFVPQEDARDSKTAGWVVQVASFSDRSKALALRDRLRKKDYTAFVESVTTRQATLYRVRVGPVTQKEEAASLQKKIGTEFRIKDTLVMAHP